MNPVSSAEIERQRAQLVVWWTIWFALLAGVVVMFLKFGGRTAPETRQLGEIEIAAIGFVFASSLVRWFVLPRFTEMSRAFPIFVIGLALAEGCAVLGIFLSHFRAELFVLGLLAMAQYVPLFARRYLQPVTERGAVR